MLKKDSGSSLLETLVSIGVASLVMAAMGTLMMNMAREMKSMTEKMASLDVEKVLIQALSDGSLCTKMLTDISYHSGNPKSFDPSRIGSSSPPEISLPNDQIIGGSSSTLYDGPFLLKKDRKASALSQSLIVSSVKIGNISDLGSGDTYLADFIVTFDTSKLVRPIKPLTVSTILKTDNSTPRRILFCGAKGRDVVVRTAAKTSWRWPSITVNCQAGEKATGGGGDCTGGDGFNFIYRNHPVSDTGWFVSCDTPEHQNVTATVYVICSR